ncbi:MAG: hypothetical protein WC974_05180 [Thermoplasmata archaeon]
MINDELSSLNPTIVLWNIKSIFNKQPTSVTYENFGLIGTKLGRYPIDAWKPYYLEVPKNGNKKDTVGRGHQAFGISLENTPWNLKRTIVLPEYTRFQNFDIEQMKLIVKHWTDICIPEDVPCIAIAVKCRGYYCDDRAAQSIAVLTIWNDAVCRITSLDWAEGPLEDCITPEWYIETTSLMNLDEAVERMQKIYENISWENKAFSIFTIPSGIGCDINEKTSSTTHAPWGSELKYECYAELKNDLNIMFSQIRSIFFTNSVSNIGDRITNFRTNDAKKGGRNNE